MSYTPNLNHSLLESLNDHLTDLAEAKDTSTIKVLWIVDEHAVALTPSTLPQDIEFHFLSNRIDQFEKLQQAGLNATFSDFDFSPYEPSSFDAILYRISKEKAVVHNIINQAATYLKPQGLLAIAGAKNEGLKTYADKAAKYLQCDKNIHKITKDLWISELSNATTDSETDLKSNRLDCKNYDQFIDVGEQNGIHFCSKPGVFGWNKIDQGSALLIEQMPEFVKRQGDCKSVIDLGCGYGYLSSQMPQFGFERIVATDNNASAIAATKKTFEKNNLSGDVIAADCGEGIDEKFDAVICNPPFHQGFNVENQLTDRFLARTRSLLASGGSALFVVNSFIPIEAKATQYFKKIDQLASNKSFKVIRLSGKKPFRAIS